MQLQRTNARIGRILLTMLLAMAAVSVQSQQQTPARNPQATFQATTDHIRSDVRVRDSKGQFISDLKPDEFKVLEDGVPQKITTFYRAIGGRMLSELAEMPVARTEGLILPPAAPPKDMSGPHLHRLHRRHAPAGARLDQDPQAARAHPRHDPPRKRPRRHRLDAAIRRSPSI